MTQPVSSIRNLGPKSEAMYARAGITSAEEVRELGAEEAYLRLLEAGIRPHFIGFYALWLGLQDRPWNDLDPDEKSVLRGIFDAVVARAKGTSDGPDAALTRALDNIGVR